jgi:signal-transduction protein with cAMP-binding, CBS, and nucleotidyltransferase domain
LNHRPAAPTEVTRFLREYPPFDGLELATVERVAAAAEVEFYRAGATIVAQQAEPVEHLWVIRSG